MHTHVVEGPHARSPRAMSVAVTLALACIVSACHVVSEEELAKIRQAGQHAGPDADRTFAEKVIPNARKQAHPAGEVVAALADDFDAACSKYGFRQSSAFPCNFWMTVQGKVVEVNMKSRVGKVVVEVPGTGTGPARVALQVGPVLVGTGVRDGTQDIRYADFDDQTRFAEFGQALNRLVVDRLSRAREAKEGDTIDALAVHSGWSAPTSDVTAVPVEWK